MSTATRKILPKVNWYLRIDAGYLNLFGLYKKESCGHRFTKLFWMQCRDALSSCQSHPVWKQLGFTEKGAVIPIWQEEKNTLCLNYDYHWKYGYLHPKLQVPQQGLPGRTKNACRSWSPPKNPAIKPAVSAIRPAALHPLTCNAIPITIVCH